MDQTPAWEDIISDAMDSRLDSVSTSQPGRIESFDPQTRTATVQPLLRNGYYNEFNQRVTERLPALQGVPVLFRGGGGFEETWPVTSGDLCLIIHTFSSINAWKTGTGGEVDSGDDRKHYIGDAVAIVGLKTMQGQRNTTTDGYTVGAVNGPVINVTSAEVKLGGTDASQSAILGDTYRSAEDTLLNALGVFATAIGALDPFTASGAAVTLNAAITSFQSAAATYKSSIVKAK